MTVSLLDDLQPAWRQLTGTELHYQPAPLPLPDTRWRVPLEYDGEPLGWLSLAAPPAGYSEAATRHLLTVCAQLLAAALGEQNIAQGLADEVLVAWNQIAFLYEVVKINSTNASSHDVGAKLSALAKEVFRCQNAFVAFRNRGQRVYRSAEPLNEAAIDDYFALLAQEKIVLLSDRNPNFLGVRVTLTTPGEAIIGLIGSEVGEFKARERQLIEGLAEQIGTVLDSIALQQQLTASLRLKHELEIAAQIQSSLLPAHLPQPDGYELAGVVVPASQVGGDFYDVVEIDADTLAILMGDVAGKGIPAAMLTTLIRAELRGQALAGVAPGNALARANLALEPDLNRLQTFATALVARLRPAQSTLTFASAGHTASFYWRAPVRASQELLSTALPLGVFPESTHAEHVITMEPGDVLVLYSDGVTEALNSVGQVFGWEGLELVLSVTQTAPADVIKQAILLAVEVHRGGQAMSDDLAVCVLKKQTVRDVSLAARAYQPFAMSAHLGQLKTLERSFDHVLAPWAHLPEVETWRFEVELAVEEHVSNIIRHAYDGQSDRQLQGLFTLYPDRFVVETVDNGAAFDPGYLEAEMPRATNVMEAAEGGYGLPLMRVVMDDVRYERQAAGRNYWWMERRTPSGMRGSSV